MSNQLTSAPQSSVLPSNPPAFASNNPYATPTAGAGIQSGPPVAMVGNSPDMAIAGPIGTRITPREIRFPLANVQAERTGPVQTTRIGAIPNITANVRNFAVATLAGLYAGPDGVISPRISIHVHASLNNSGNFGVYACVAPGYAAAPTTWAEILMRPGSVAIVGGSGMGPRHGQQNQGAPPPSTWTADLWVPPTAALQIHPSPLTDVAPVLYTAIWSGADTRVLVFGSLDVVMEGTGYGTWSAPTWPPAA